VRNPTSLALVALMVVIIGAAAFQLFLAAG
jgi:hypothetical protein